MDWMTMFGGGGGYSSEATSGAEGGYIRMGGANIGGSNSMMIGLVVVGLAIFLVVRK